MYDKSYVRVRGFELDIVEKKIYKQYHKKNARGQTSTAMVFSFVASPFRAVEVGFGWTHLRLML